MKKHDEYYICIGVSANRVESLQTFLKEIPCDTGMTFIIIQHYRTNQEKITHKALANFTNMQISIIENEMIIEPNKIYLLDSPNNLTIKNGFFKLINANSENALNFAIDYFMCEISAYKKEKSIGVLLTSAEKDGALGTISIREAGGIVLAEPNYFTATDIIKESSVDYILEPKNIPLQIIEYVGRKVTKASIGINSFEENSEKDYERILALIKQYSKIDFSHYKEATIQRRISRRVILKKCSSVFEYTNLLTNDEKEREILLSELLIGVTKFFRDIEAFDSLYEKVLPNLDYKKGVIRVWIVACSTGEEAYSLAILINEYLEKNCIECEVKIFATDLNEVSVNFASNGVYDVNAIVDMDINLRNKYFEPYYDEYKINEDIRKMVVFAKHNVLADPPFSKIDLLTCRNMFIYIKQDIQKHILTNFYFSLVESGFLVLGSSETIGNMSDAFLTVDSKWKIYKYINGYNSVEKNINNPKTNIQLEYEKIMFPKERTINKIENLSIDIINNISPPALVINDNDEVIQLINGVANLIEIESSIFTNNYRSFMCSEDIILISSILRQLKDTKNKEVVLNNILISKSEKLFDLKGTKIRSELADYYLIKFIEKGKIEDTKKVQVINIEEETKNRISELERELKFANEGLHATVEELVTANEELNSSNEELIASNEELISSNEQLENAIKIIEESKEFLDATTEAANIGAWLVNFQDKNYVWATDTGAKIFGLKLRKDRTYHFTDIKDRLTKHMTKEEIEDNVTKFRKVVQGKDENFVGLLKLEDYNGEIRWIEVRSNAINRDNKGVAKKMPGVMIDITDRILKQKELENIRETLLETNEGGLVGSWYIDYSKSDEYFWATDITANMCGIPLNEDNMYLLSDWAKAVELGNGKEESIIINQVLIDAKNGVKDEYNANFKCKGNDGITRWYNSKSVNIKRDEDGKAIKIPGVLIDITESVEREQELKRIEETLIETNEGGLIGSWYIDYSKSDEHFWATDITANMCGIAIRDDKTYKLSDWAKAVEIGNGTEEAKAINQVLLDAKDGLKEEYSANFKCIGNDGVARWYNSKSVNIKRDKDGKAIKIPGVLIDITELITSKNLKKVEEKKINLSIENAGIIYWEYDLENIITTSNEQGYYDFFGFFPKDLIEIWFAKMNDLDIEKVSKAFEDIKNGTSDKLEATFRLHHSVKDKEIWIKSIGTVQTFIEGKKVLYGMSQDITLEMEHRSKELEYYFDSLTKAKTRSAFKRDFQNGLLKDKIIAFFDINSFKSYNDIYGYTFGDKVLVGFAEAMMEIKIFDLYRIGGDEFVAVVNDTSVKLSEFSNYIKPFVSLKIEGYDNKINVYSTIGVVEKYNEEDTLSSLMKKLDIVKSVAKKDNVQFRIFDERMLLDYNAKADLKNAITKSVENNEIYVAIQSIEDMKKGHTMGYESLVRWKRNGKIIPPSEFLDIAREAGYLHIIDLYVFEQMVKDYDENKDLVKGSIQIFSSNVDVTSLAKISSGAFIDIVKKYNQKASNFTIEVTEEVLLREEFLIKLKKLKAAGFNIAIDDFSSKHSSLHYITTGAFNIIKFDKVLVDRVISDERSRIVFENLLRMCRELNVRVIVEGIEKKEQAKYLTDLNVSFGQGYYFSKPSIVYNR